MEVLVCIKIVPDIEMVIPTDWIKVKDLKSLDIGYVNNIINTFDQCALELALRLGDKAKKNGIDYKLSIISIGGEECEPVLKNIFPLKVDRIIRIENEKEINNNPLAIATIIGNAINKLGPFDLIFFGIQASEYDNGQVGLVVAEILELPCVTNVTEIDLGESYTIITHQTDIGLETIHIDTPVVLTVGNTSDIYLRLATLKDKIKARGRNIELFSLEQLGLCSQKLFEMDKRKVIEIFAQQNQRDCKIIRGTRQEKAEKLYNIINHIKK